MYRQEFASNLLELDRDREKLNKKKKKTKEKVRLLHENSQWRLFYKATAINNTVKYFKKLYYADDSYRKKKLMEIEDNPYYQPEEKERKKLEQLKTFYLSPFKDDRKFAVDYLTKLSRSSITNSIPLVDTLYYDKIFESLLNIENEFCFRSLEIFSNLIHEEDQRKKLATDGYIKRLFDYYTSDYTIDKLNVTEEMDIKFKILEKISWMTTLISFYPDLIQEIIRFDLLDFIILISTKRFSTKIRANAVLALSLLTYHDEIFDELLDKKVIDLVMELCKDPFDNIQVKQYSTLALVHFALNKRSIHFLIEKGVMELFNSFGKFNDKTIKTNVSWIFLALCNNGITGKEMVESGITKDMFLVSCDPKLDQVRHLVIAGFAELGRCLELKAEEEEKLSHELQIIKESAIVGMHKNFKGEPEKTISILLHFTVSESEIHQVMAYWAIKDYIMLNHESLIDDMSSVIHAFVNGSVSLNDHVSVECANAISFLITHRIVYPPVKLTESLQPQTMSCVMDALMHLTGHKSKFIKTRAFSTLSTLSTYCSSSEDVKQVIENDLKIPGQGSSKQYYEFIRGRIDEGLEKFRSQYCSKEVEESNQGLYWLLRIAKEPTDEIIREAADKMYEYIVENQQEKDQLNEAFYISVFQTLKHAQDKKILLKVLKVIKHYNNRVSPFQKEVISPDTILWLLKILKKHEQDKQLTCRAGLALLEIVQMHQIKFDYQEVAIIRKFNKALQILGVFMPHQIDEDSISSSDEETKSLNSESESEEDKNQEESKQSQVPSEKPPVLSSHNLLEQEILQDIYNAKDLTKEGKRSVQSEDQDELNQEIRSSSSQTGGSQSDYRIKVIQEQNDDEVVAKSDNSISESQKYSEQAVLEVVGQANSGNVSNQNSQQEIDNQSQSQKNYILKDMTESGNQHSKQLLIEQMSAQSRIMEEEIVKGSQQSYQKIYAQMKTSYTNIEVLRDSLTFKLEVNNQISESSHIQSAEGSIQDVENETEDEVAQQQILRQSLIKAFLVIFTNENSQHLLLNQDLIDLAFNCLEFTHDLADEARLKLAKLISLIYKFPQIKQYMLKPEVVEGVIHLLTVTNGNFQEVIQHTVKACTYLTLNFEFVSSPSSINMLIKMIPLIDFYQQEESGEMNLADLILCISNLLRGSQQNKEYFFNNVGLKKYFNFILESNQIEFIELLVQGIKEVISLDVALKQVLQSYETSLIKQIFSKCLNMTDDWQDQMMPNNDFGYDSDEKQITKYQSKFSMASSITNNQDDQKVMVMCTSTKVMIRNNIYFLIYRCLNAGMQKAEVQRDCNLIQRVLNDLMQNRDNHFLFGNLILTLDSFKDDAQFATEQIIIPQYNKFLTLISEYPNFDNKIALMKVFINLIVTSMDILCETKQGIQLFDVLFKMLNQTKIEDEIQESVMWLINSMVELGESQNVIQVCIDHKVVSLISELIQHSHSLRTLLQSLNTLQALSKEKELLKSFNDTALLNHLYEIANIPKLSLEISTSLYHLLANISTNNDQICDYICQLGFLSLIFDNLSDLRYSIENSEAIGIINEDSLDQEYSINYITTDNNQNEVNEALIKILSNICNMKTNQHLNMINMGIIEFIKRYLQYYAHYEYQSPIKQENKKVNIGILSTGNITLARDISFIVHSLTKNVEIQELLVHRDIVSVIKHCNRLLEYEVLTNTYLSIGNLMLSPLEHVRKRAVELGCMEILLDSNEESEFLRIRRICNSVLQQTDPRLFEYNDLCRGNSAQ